MEISHLTQKRWGGRMDVWKVGRRMKDGSRTCCQLVGWKKNDWEDGRKILKLGDCKNGENC